MGSVLSANGKMRDNSLLQGGAYRRIISTEFELNKDSASNATAGNYSVDLAIETMISKRTLMGWSMTVDGSLSSVKDTFRGNIDRQGLGAGLYGVHKFNQNVYMEGYAAITKNKHDMNLQNDVLRVQSDYDTQSLTSGLAITGVAEFGKFAILPEASFAYGHTKVGIVDLRGWAYGLYDGNLHLDAGNVSIRQWALRPEIRYAFDVDKATASRNWLYATPQWSCERVLALARRTDCSLGLDVGWKWVSRDNAQKMEIRFLSDNLDAKHKNRLQLKLEKIF